MNSTFTVLATDSLGATGTQAYTIGIYWNPTEISFQNTFAGYDADMGSRKKQTLTLTGISR